MSSVARNRRVHDRVPANSPALLVRAHGVETVHVSDVSINGAGLEGVQDPAPGERVKLVVHGRSFRARICWSDLDRCGVGIE